MASRAGSRAVLAFATTAFLSLPAQADSHSGMGYDGIAIGSSDATYSVPGIEVGGFVSDDGGSGEINTILPLSMPTSHQLFFIGADGKLFSNGVSDSGDSVYNAGGYLGYRERMESGVFGAWAGADHLQTRNGNTFNRFIAGAEYYGARVIARVNGFVPFDSTSDEWSQTVVTTATAPVTVTTPLAITTLDRTTTTTTTTFYDEKVPSGIDGELGLRFILPSFRDHSRNGEFRIFAGAYDYFSLKADGGDVPGVRGRLELDLYPFEQAPDMRLSFDASYSHDDYADGQFAGGARLFIPLGRPRSLASDYSGSLKDGGGGSLKDDPAPVAVASSGSKDLFQPVRRNREPVSVIREKRTVSTSTVTDKVKNAQQTQAYTLATVCGSGPIPIDWQGQNPGDFASTISPAGLIGQLTDGSIPGGNWIFNLAALTNGSGQTLAQLLTTSTQSFSGTFSLPMPSPNIAVNLDESIVPLPASGGAGGLNVVISSGSCQLQFEGLSFGSSSSAS